MSTQNWDDLETFIPVTNYGWWNSFTQDEIDNNEGLQRVWADLTRFVS